MQAPQGSSDPAALAAELVAGGPEAVMPFLEALDEALGEHDADLKRLVLALDEALGEHDADLKRLVLAMGKRDDDDDEDDDEEEPYEGGGASMAAMNAPAGLTEQAAPGGRNRLSLR
jgi:hypothetical protein